MFRLSKNIFVVAALWAGVVAVPLASISITAYSVSKSTQKKTTRSSKSKAKTTSKCDRNYSSCVPIASDVDCLPGSGNGPKYVSKAVKVLKSDIYRLDGDKDGIGCERN